MKFKQWVVISPEGNVTWAKYLGHRVHDTKRQAIAEVRRLATWEIELRDNLEYWDRITWTEAKKNGWNIKQCWLDVAGVTE